MHYKSSTAILCTVGILLTLLVGVVVGAKLVGRRLIPESMTATGIRTTASSSIQIGPRNRWKRYTSSKAGISFDYPEGWQITDVTFTSKTLQDRSKSIIYDSLWVCPPDSELLATTEGGISNCISFFTSDRILQPPLAFVDESAIFQMFTSYIDDRKNEDYENFRIVSWLTPVSQNAEIGLLGFYRQEASFVGLNQPLCPVDKGTKCMIVFNQVLDSVGFVTR
jgi:hypothetical protein